MNVYEKLKELGLELPPLAVPAAAYVPFAQTGKTVFLRATSPARTASPGSASSARTSTPKPERPPRVPWPST